MTRKLISAIVAIMMAFSIVATVAVSADDRFPADDNTKPCLTIGTVECKASGKVVVPISVSRNTGIWGANFQIAYDSNLTFDSDSSDGCIMQGASMINNDATNRIVTLVVTNTADNQKDFNNNSQNGVLIKLTFNVNYSAGKTLPVSFAYTDNNGKLCIIDSNAGDVNFVYVNGGVKCVNNSTPVNPSNPANPSNPTNPTKPVAPTMNTKAKPAIKLVKAKKAITLKLTKKVAYAQGYEVQYSLNKKFKKAKKITLKANAKSKKIKKLKAKKKYYVRVRAFAKVNGKKVYSKWAVKNVKTK